MPIAEISTKHHGETKKINPVNLEFYASISHEIRNPLNAIIGLSHLLKKSTSEEDRENYIDNLLQTSENLLELVNNILDFSKLETGNVVYTPKPTDLKTFLNQILINQKIIAEAKGISFIVEVDENIPQLVSVEPVKLNQVILNLISNAIKFTSEGSVTIKLQVMESNFSEISVKFTVTDTGIGIQNEKLDIIFEAFKQGDEDVNMKYGGTGLGLHISKKLVEQLGGKLAVKSQPGRGSEFSFQLNMNIVENIASTDLKNRITPEIFNKKLKVLIVDDNNLNILVVRKNLENWGIRSEVTHNGVDAVEKVKQQDFDMVLMDLHMPKMDGLEATQKIRAFAENKNRELPIIALTASTDKFFEEKVQFAGFTDKLNKPFRPQELLEKLITYSKFGQADESIPV